jgi:hypothetical protein
MRSGCYEFSHPFEPPIEAYTSLYVRISAQKATRLGRLLENQTHPYATVSRGSQDHKEQIPGGLSQQTMMGHTKGLNVTTGSRNRVAKI